MDKEKNSQDNFDLFIYEDEGEEIFSSEKKEHYYRSEKNKKKKEKRSKGKKNKKKRLLIVITALLLVIALLLTAWLVLLKKFDYNYNDLDATNSDLGFEEIINKKIVNIALFGVDTRSVTSLTGNTDSIMILSLNTETKKVKITSVMRDCLAEIDKDGEKMYRKINAAYAYGGPELAIKTLNQNFRLDISEYATVNFFGMAEIIDVIGGIEVELTENEVAPYDPNGLEALNSCIYGICLRLKLDPKDYVITTPGKHHLNGIQAVAYSRIRKVKNIWGTNDDFGRTERQRYVMEQLFEKVKKLPKTKYVSLVQKLIPYTETSLSVNEVVSLATNIMIQSPVFEQSRIPLDEYRMTAIHKIPAAGSYVYFDRDYAADVLHAFIYDDIDPKDYMAQNPVRKNDWYGEIIR